MTKEIQNLSINELCFNIKETINGEKISIPQYRLDSNRSKVRYLWEDGKPTSTPKDIQVAVRSLSAVNALEKAGSDINNLNVTFFYVKYTHDLEEKILNKDLKNVKFSNISVIASLKRSGNFSSIEPQFHAETLENV